MFLRMCLVSANIRIFSIFWKCQLKWICNWDVLEILLGFVLNVQCFLCWRHMVRGLIVWFFVWKVWIVYKLEYFVSSMEQIGWLGLCIFIRPFMVSANGFRFMYFNLKFCGMNILCFFIVFLIWFERFLWGLY